MKKLALVACSLFALASVAQAKEVVSQPVITSSKEVVAEPAPIVEEVVTVAPIVAPVAEQAPDYINLRVGGDVWSKYSRLNNGSQSLSRDTKDLGYQIAIEGYKTYDNIDLGLGMAYQDHAKRKGGDSFDNKGAEYKSMPIYLTARHNMTYLNLPFTPYVKANAGYSFNFDSKDITNDQGQRVHTSVDNGAYWAAGAGVQYNNVNVDLMYGTNYAKVKYDNQKHNNNYDAVTLSVGYKFDM